MLEKDTPTFLVSSPSKGKTELEETRLYNSMVLGMQNYYQIATNVNQNCFSLKRENGIRRNKTL
ncbi:hypothetical protein EfmAA818_29540 (plasmid) [Enterococcus faecium]|nr:hypothetical protein EfmAA818_29540 [Enterococcus faecium]